jgi:hypothetical protein
VARARANEGDDDISKVSEHLGQGRVAVVAEEGLHELTCNGVFVEDHVDIPNVFDDARDPADFVEFMDAVCDESSREED